MKNKVSFASLGGLGEIGLNSYIYSSFSEEEQEFLLVDLGMGFKDLRISPMETFFPDISFFLENGIKPLGLVITHGHEDHIGAIPYLIEYLNCPIYATAWTLDLIRSKLKEFGLDTKIKLIEVDHHKAYNIGNFTVKWIPSYHSIIDCSVLSITTSLGKIVHTGDFKIPYSNSSVIEGLKNLEKEKADYLVCDSTNVMSLGSSGEEIETKESLTEIISAAKGASWIGMFSSNLERIKIIAGIAQNLKKRIVLYGRSINTYVNLAIKHGYLDSNFFITEEESRKIERNKLIILATGSQGEDRSVLYNVIIRDEYKEKLKEHDIVIFSSKVIPGNEAKILRYYNILADRNIDYFTADGYNIHVSGHAKQNDLKLMYDFVKPKYIIPMHGEIMHLRYHTEFAKSLGYKSKFFHCGDVVELFNGDPKVIDQINVGKLTYEGNRVVSFNEDFIKVRTKLFFEGAVFICLYLTKKRAIEDIFIEVLGLLCEDEKEDYKNKILYKMSDFLNYTDKLESEEEVKEELRKLIRRFFKETLDKKPVISINLRIR